MQSVFPAESTTIIPVTKLKVKVSSDRTCQIQKQRRRRVTTSNRSFHNQSQMSYFTPYNRETPIALLPIRRWLTAKHHKISISRNKYITNRYERWKSMKRCVLKPLSIENTGNSGWINQPIRAHFPLSLNAYCVEERKADMRTALGLSCIV